jgi:ABC-type bacteriocin/lantibiotic exporter with double-glycine peptidase domain
MNMARQLWAILTVAQRRWVLLAQFASLVMALSTITGIAAISPFFAVLGDPGLIDRIPALSWLYGHLGIHSKHGFIVALGIGFVVIVLLTNLINLLGWYALLRLSLWIGDDLKLTLFREYLHRDYLFHVRSNSTALFNNIANETSRVTIGILQSCFLLVTSLITAGLIIVSILLVNPLAAVAVVSGLIGGYFLIYLAVRHRILRSGRLESELAAGQTKLVLEALGAIRDIIVLRRQEFFQHRFRSSSRALSQIAAYIDATTHSPRHLMEFIAVGGLVAAALLLSGADGDIGRWLAQLTFLGFAVYRLLPSLQQAFAAIVKMRAARPGFAAIAADLLRARMMPVEAAPATSVAPGRLRSGITLNDVCFRYAAQLPAALRDVSLTIPAGAIIGLVGSNGSGKTTLVDILAGLLVPDSGQVEIDDVELDEATRPEWRQRIAYVPQSIFLLDATVAENIALATAPGDIDLERMLNAARLARLDELIMALPHGYREVIGERGVRLSGGQRQRLGIARALYRDASVLIMDEATNALDVFAEAEVMSAITALRGERTIILIAHRLSTLRQCDLIFELDEGAIVRSGSWNDLMRGSKRFSIALQSGAVQGESRP